MIVIAIAILISAEVAVELGAAVYSIDAVSLRQVMVPEHLQGRVNATMRVAGGGAGLLGAVIGGVLGETVGLRQTIVIAGIGTVSSCLVLAISPIRRLRTAPELSLERSAP